jgi:hypothetical protein
MLFPIASGWFKTSSSVLQPRMAVRRRPGERHDGRSEHVHETVGLPIVRAALSCPSAARVAGPVAGPLTRFPPALMLNVMFALPLMSMAMPMRKSARGVAAVWSG